MAIVYGAFVLLTWLPRALAGRWIADDYCFALSSVRDGFWRSQQLVYLNASGRFSVAFFYAALTRLGRWAAPYIAIALMIVWIVAACRAMSYALAEASRLEQIAGGIAFVAAVVAASPDTYQPLIWTGGVATYGLPVICATVIAALILSGKPRRLPLVILLAFFSGGCSEVAAAAQAIFSIALAPFFRRARSPLIATAIASAAALAIVAIAPGNFKRRTLFVGLPIPDAVSTALIDTPRMLEAILVQGYAPFVVMMVFFALTRRNVLQARIVIAAVVASCAVITVTLSGALYGTGRLPWGRVQFIPVAYTALGLIFIAFAIRVEKRLIAAALTAAMVLLGLVDIVSTTRPRTDAIVEARQFATRTDEIDRLARSRRGQHLIVRAPQEYEFLEVLSRDPRHWTNRCMADYYGLTSISRR
jgi:uncharacterized protein DUF6056